MVVQIQGWRRWEWLRHGFSIRKGGVSIAYGREGDLNLGWTKEDEHSRVAENRRRFLESVSRNAQADEAGWKLVTLRQIHSGVVHAVGTEALEGSLETAEGKAVLEGDGIMTSVPGVMAAVGTADCVPILLVDTQQRVVAALHAGWRGTAAGIAEAGIAKMRSEYGSHVEDLAAAVGPSIGACCYAVGEEVREAFTARYRYADELFQNIGQAMHVDLWDANRRQLLGAGLKDAQITVVGECTACVRDEQGARKYFSHRADRGVAGRMLSAIGVAPSAK